MSIRALIIGLLACCVFLAFLLVSAAHSRSTLRASQTRWRWLVLPSSFLVVVGMCGFFSQMVSGVGGLNWLPPTFQWPAGLPDDALTAADGAHVILLGAAGRIQIYDAHWRFLRGWPVLAPLRLRLLPNGTIEALTKGEEGVVFNVNGELLARRTYSVGESVRLFNSLPPRENVLVPTSPWLWIFSSPFLSWIVAAVGFSGWFFVHWISKKSGEQNTQSDIQVPRHDYDSR